MSDRGVHQPNAFIRISDIIVRENGAFGKCLPSAFFQGYHLGRHSQREIDGLIADAMDIMISWTELTNQVC
jgi:hypothetical protein